MAQADPPPPVFVDASAAADERGVVAAPAAALLAPVEPAAHAPGPFAWRLLAIGAPRDVARHPAVARARRLALPDAILTPAYANAHTHLDLSALGTIPIGREGFVGWIQALRAARRDRLASDAAIEASVELGAALSIAGAVVAVGDIAGDGRLAPFRALRRSPVMGVSFIEFFGLGAGLEASRARLLDLADESRAAAHASRSPMQVRLGLQPHAPYSTGDAIYAAAGARAREQGVPVATHVAESIDERMFVGQALGPIRTLLESLGLWDDAVAACFCVNRSPVEQVSAALAGAGVILAHCNDVDDGDIERLAAMGASVAYCPRSSAYLGHTQRLGPHRYRDMLAAGIPVALATDSVASLPGFSDPATGGHRITPLDDARHLWRAGERDAALLLRMITTSPAAMLGLDAAHFRFREGSVIAGVVATTTGSAAATGPSATPIARLFAGDGRPTLLAPPDAQQASL